MCSGINNIAIRGAVTIAKTAVTSHEAPPPWVNGLRQGRRSPLFNRFASPFGKTPSRSRWVSQSLLNFEDTRHPLFAYYRQQWGQVWGAKSRLPIDDEEEAREDRKGWRGNREREFDDGSQNQSSRS